MLPRRDPVRIVVRPSRGLTSRELDEIWELTDRYVETVRPVFEDKLRHLPRTALFRSGTGALVGVASLDVYRVRHQGRAASIIFTSSVVVDERYRRRNLVLRLGIRTFLAARLRRPLDPIHWFFDTFSYKSFVLLPRNFVEYWPRRDQPTPAPVAALIDTLARPRYGAAWDPEAGVVARSGQKRLRPGTAPIDDDRLGDPDIRFFDTINPGHREGDMLVCLCPLNLSNWAFAIRNAFHHRKAVENRVRRIRHSAAIRRRSETLMKIDA